MYLITAIIVSFCAISLKLGIEQFVLAWGGSGRGRSRISTPWGTLVGQDPAATASQQFAASPYIASQRWDSPAMAREPLAF